MLFYDIRINYPEGDSELVKWTNDEKEALDFFLELRHGCHLDNVKLMRHGFGRLDFWDEGINCWVTV